MNEITDRDLECLALTAFLTNQEIAHYLRINRVTVRWHLQRAYDALGIPGYIQGRNRRLLAVATAITEGYLTYNYMAQLERAVYSLTQEVLA